jgi:hypothetical protein
MTRDGYKKFLDCPSCGEPCLELPAYAETSEHRYPHWQEGDYATCKCGADLVVEAGGEKAWLKELEDES